MAEALLRGFGSLLVTTDRSSEIGFSRGKTANGSEILRCRQG